MRRLLDLFCGAGGAGMGYYRAGFEVVGVDIKPQLHYPFEFHQADALRYPLEGFDAYHASPPCQAFTRAFQPMLGRKPHPNLIGITRERLINTSLPFVIENVPGAPLHNYIRVNGTMFGIKTIKERWFEIHGFDLLLLPAPLINTAGMVKSGKLVGIMEHSYYENEIRPTAQNLASAYEIDWYMNRQELRQAIPPAYTEYIGKELIKRIGQNGVNFEAEQSGKFDSLKRNLFKGV